MADILYNMSYIVFYESDPYDYFAYYLTRTFPVEVPKNARFGTVNVHYDTIGGATNATRYRLLIKWKNADGEWSFPIGETTSVAGVLTFHDMKTWHYVSKPVDIQLVVQCKREIIFGWETDWETAPNGATNWMRVNPKVDEPNVDPTVVWYKEMTALYQTTGSCYVGKQCDFKVGNSVSGQVYFKLVDGSPASAKVKLWRYQYGSWSQVGSEYLINNGQLLSTGTLWSGTLSNIFTMPNSANDYRFELLTKTASGSWKSSYSGIIRLNPLQTQTPADVRISTVSLSDLNVDISEEVTLTLRVKNYGQARSGNVAYRIDFGEGEVLTGVTSSLEGSQEQVIYERYRYQTAGSKTVRVSVGNDSRTIIVTVNNPPNPNITISNPVISVNSTNYDLNSSRSATSDVNAVLRGSARLKNTGGFGRRVEVYLTRGGPTTIIPASMQTYTEIAAGKQFDVLTKEITLTQESDSNKYGIAVRVYDSSGTLLTTVPISTALNLSVVKSVPKFSIGNITCTTPEASRVVGRTLYFSIPVSNTGTASGTEKLVMDVISPENLPNHVVKNITLNAGASTTASFPFIPDYSGTYLFTFRIGNVTKQFTCVVSGDSPSEKGLLFNGSLSLNPSTATLGDTVMVGVPIINTGSGTSTYTIKIYVHDLGQSVTEGSLTSSMFVDSRAGSLSAGKSTTQMFPLLVTGDLNGDGVIYVTVVLGKDSSTTIDLKTQAIQIQSGGPGPDPVPVPDPDPYPDPEPVPEIEEVCDNGTIWRRDSSSVTWTDTGEPCEHCTYGVLWRYQNGELINTGEPCDDGGGGGGSGGGGGGGSGETESMCVDGVIWTYDTTKGEWTNTKKPCENCIDGVKWIYENGNWVNTGKSCIGSGDPKPGDKFTECRSINGKLTLWKYDTSSKKWVDTGKTCSSATCMVIPGLESVGCVPMMYLYGGAALFLLALLKKKKK